MEWFPPQAHIIITHRRSRYARCRTCKKLYKIPKKCLLSNFLRGLLKCLFSYFSYRQLNLPKYYREIVNRTFILPISIKLVNRQRYNNSKTNWMSRFTDSSSAILEFLMECTKYFARFWPIKFQSSFSLAY